MSDMDITITITGRYHSDTVNDVIDAIHEGAEKVKDRGDRMIGRTAARINYAKAKRMLRIADDIAKQADAQIEAEENIRRIARIAASADTIDGRLRTL